MEMETGGVDSGLDFENEDPLLATPVVPKRRKKVIGLDELLADYFREKSQIVEKESKRAKTQRDYDSDEEGNDKENEFSKVVDECHRQIHEMSGEEENTSWGIRVFGNQQKNPDICPPELNNSRLLQSCTDSGLNTLFGLTPDEGESLLDGLLVNGWLSKLVVASGHLENAVAKWTFNLMLYSAKEDLRSSAWDLWCAVLSCRDENGLLPIKIEWLPGFTELRKALDIYGFMFNLSSGTGIIQGGSGCSGPPQNIRAWVKFASCCCQVRGIHPLFSTVEAEELIEVIILLSLDRQLQGLSMILYSCLQSAINCFADDEWTSSCENIAMSLASRVPVDLNCLQTVECIGGANFRMQQLRSAISYKFLASCIGHGVTDVEILQTLLQINVKEKSCDLFKMYIYLVLTENWLLPNSILKDNNTVKEMWGLLLRNCSCQISSTDLRSFASKVRDRASYLLQGSYN